MMNNSFKALGDPTRTEILSMLKERDMTAGEISEHFNMSKPSISHHLAILRQAELVKDKKDGQNVIYSLNDNAVSEVLQWFIEILQ